MGHGKETPRQKMIGMMYLVLTALLALNVSKEVLDAFVIVDSGLHATNESFKNKIDYVYNEIDKQALIKEVQVKPVQEAAREAREWSQELYNFIEDIKIDLIVEIDGVDEAAADTLAKNIIGVQSKDNYDAPTHHLLGSDVNQLDQSKARELKDKLDKYRSDMLALFDRGGIELLNEKVVLENLGDLGIDTKDKRDGKPEERHWEYKKFYHAPLWAVLAILTQIQSEVLNAESVIADKLLSSIGAGEFKFNLLEPTVIAKSNYVIKGNEYNAEVFLAAFDTTQSPEIKIGEYKKNEDGNYEMIGNNYEVLPIEGGRGIYKLKENGTGFKKWGGLISLTAPDGTTKSYPFESEYQVAEANLVISPTKVNVFYVGLDNPVDISVPGYSPSEVSATISNGSMRKDRSVGYIVTPKKPGTAIITVYAESEGKRKSIGTKEFRVFPLPTPIAKVAGKTGGSISKGLLAAQSGVLADLENFLFELRYMVTEFTVSTAIQGYTVDKSTKGNKFTPDQIDLIKSAKRGSKIYIEDITAVGPDNIPRKLGTITFKIQ